MAGSKRGAKKQSKAKPKSSRRQAPRSEHGDLRVVALPKARMPELFRTIQQIIDAASEALFSAVRPATKAAELELHMLNRGTNAVRSAKLLLEHAQWEFAASVVRSLYEMDLNLEWLQGMPDREEAAFRFVGFGVLQKGLGKAAGLDYDAATGRLDDPAAGAVLRRRLAQMFPYFHTKDANDGTSQFAPSWCGKNTRDLAALSANTMRLPQYLNLFKGQWSEQTHASPTVHVDALFSDIGSADWHNDALLSDDVEVIQQSMLLVTLFLELCERIEGVTHPESLTRLQWTDAILEVARKRHPEGMPILSRVES